MRISSLPSPEVHISRLLSFYNLDNSPQAISAALSQVIPFVTRISDQQLADTLTACNIYAANSYSSALVASGLAHYQVTHQPRTSVAGSSAAGGFSVDWLRLRVGRLAIVDDSGAGLNAAEMALSVLSLLAHEGKTDEEIQGDLFDAFAGDFEAVVEVLAKRKELVKGHDAVLEDCTKALDGGGIKGKGRRRRGRKGTSMEEDEEERRRPEALGGNLFEERERHFPGVQVQGDRVIGSTDRVGLPKGSTREVGKGYEEIFVPPPVGKAVITNQLVDVEAAFLQHPELLKAMKGVERFNRLQSSVFPAAFGSDENLLVCAPTGAGKTNVALLTVFREIISVKMRMKRSFKVVYVAPMKALAAEVTEKFGKRLHDLGLRVREFTGDMSLSRVEALQTHVLVTTPEKWDVVTRKSGSELGESVTLFIIDEIHLLHDDRGAVLESIVARTLRLSETAQRQIRLVGLSATLPNFADVGSFMRVDPEKGLFHFDGSHRPVPLSQTFIGISEGGSSNSAEARRKRENKMHEMAWKKVKDSLQRGHQAMIFVHSRKGTSMAAREMISRATQDGLEDIFLGGESQASGTGVTGRRVPGEDAASVMPSWATREISRSRTGDIRELCSRGVGIHNAGLPRPDRKLVEKLFAEGVIRLLCCTATLAWGVNLPARTVVIMGTEVYDAQRGGFVQLGMLDVMQIFGRAGRPQFDTEGEGTIITAHEHLGKYLNLLTSSIPIESQLGSSASTLANHLNAEVVSGTVSSVGEGVRWLSYTYLSVRMPLNPLVYGIEWAEVSADNGLHSRRATLIEQACKALDDARMCRYDPRTGVLAPTDLGRVASHFYVSHETVVLWNELLSQLSMGAAVSDADWEEVYAAVLHAVSCATEFEQMRSRQEESKELESLQRDACPIPLMAGSETREGKVSILLQAHISRATIRMSDLSYIVQSSTRLLRALFEISLRRGMPSMALASLELARASESRIWPFQHPLWQFTYSNRKTSGLIVSPETISMIEGSGDLGRLESLKTMRRDDLSSLIRAPKMALTVIRASHAVPTLSIVSARVAPLSHTVLKVDVSLFPNFRWNEAVHGRAESWRMWLSDREEDRIYHSQRIVLTRRQVVSMNEEISGKAITAGKHTLDYSFSVPVFDPPSSKYWVRVESEQWHTDGGSSAELKMSDKDLPNENVELTTLFDLRPLTVSSALTEKDAQIFPNSARHFNPLQTQAFHVARHCDGNLLISCPSGCGKWVVVELAILRAIETHPTGTVVCLVPEPNGLNLLERRWSKLKQYVGGALFTIDSRFINGNENPIQTARILISTAKKWNLFINSLKSQAIISQVSLLVVDELHLLSDSNYVDIEHVITRLISAAKNSAKKNTAPRIVGLCENIPNARQVADWLGVHHKTGLFHFDSTIKAVPIELQVIGVAGERYVSRMYSMNRTMFSIIQRHSSKKPVLIFVSSKRQTLFTAQDLIRLASVEGKRDAFLCNRDRSKGDHSKALGALNDRVLQRCVQSGIALYHEGIGNQAQQAVEYLYRSGYVQIMIATFSLSRRFAVPAHMVIVKGTEAYKPNRRGYHDIALHEIINMMGHAGRLYEDSSSHSLILVHEPKKNLIRKLLHDTLPLESSLENKLEEILLREISQNRITNFMDAVEYISWTFLFQRLKSNPGYYGILKDKRKSVSRQELVASRGVAAMKWCADRAAHCLQSLSASKCVSFSNVTMHATFLGHICAAHQLSPSAGLSLMEKVSDCSSLEELLKVIGSTASVVSLVDGIEDDAGWMRLSEQTCDKFCEHGMFANREIAAKSLGIVRGNDSGLRRGRLACYSFFVDSRAERDALGIDGRSVHEAIDVIISACFDLATEIGKLGLVMLVIQASQSLYNGIPPTNDIWNCSGFAAERACELGRSAGFVKIEDVRRDEANFNALIAKESNTTAIRIGFSRWFARRPQVELAAHFSSDDFDEAVAVVKLKRTVSLSKEGVETRAFVTEKRKGGFIVMAGSLKKNLLYGAKRIMDDGGVEWLQEVRLRLIEPDEEMDNVDVIVMSDVDMTVKTRVVLRRNPIIR